jgi:hypothetical protein
VLYSNSRYGACRYVELTMEGAGKVMVYNTGKVTVTASSRTLARRCFMDAIRKVRTCMAIQVGSKKRAATSPIAAADPKHQRMDESGSAATSVEGAAGPPNDTPMATDSAPATPAHPPDTPNDDNSEEDEEEEELVDA